MNSENPTTVLIVSNSSEFGGGDIALRNLAIKMDPVKWGVILVYPFPGPISMDLERRGYRVYYYNSLDIMARGLGKHYLIVFLMRLCKAVLFFIRLIKREKVRVVHTNSSALLSPSFAALLCGIPHVWHVREIIERPWWMRSFQRIFMPLLTQRIVCISSVVAQLYKPSIQQRKVSIIHDGVDLEIFHPFSPAHTNDLRKRLNIPSGRLVIGYCGRLLRRKGVMVLLNAAERLVEKGQDIHLLIVGVKVPKYWDHAVEIERKLTAPSFVGRVCLLIDKHNVAELLAVADIVVQPSTEPEGFGLSALEAMALEKPVVATPLGGPVDLIIPGESGLFSLPGDAEDLAAKLELLLNDKALRHKIAQNALQRVRDDFSAEQTSRKVTAVYQGLLG